jgi:pyruvate kinase
MLNLLWGVKTFYYNNLVNTDTTVREINKIAREMGYLKKGDYVINLTSMPVKEKGMVNTMRVTELK